MILAKVDKDRMVADMDKAASEFWNYPSVRWQMDFQAQWLYKEFGTPYAVDEGGMAWGRHPDDWD